MSIFKLNLDVLLDKDHQANFIINLIYSEQEVFSLHDEDLGYCDHLTLLYKPAPISLFIFPTGHL